MIDEADRILEANFEEEMKQIIKILPKVFMPMRLTDLFVSKIVFTRSFLEISVKCC